MSPSTPYADVLGIRLLAALRREQTLVPLPGELLPIDIYDVYDSFPNPFPRIPPHRLPIHVR